MERPAVNITDISNLLGEDLPIDNPVHLGNPKVSSKFNSLMSVIKSRATHAYLLRWEGGKIPRGAVIDGETIAWTQNGDVISESGKTIGSYDRVVGGGERGREQMMIIYMNKSR